MTRRKTISKRYLRKRWKGFLSQDSKGILHIDGVSVKYLAEKYGTPLYIIVERELRNRIRRFKAAFPYAKFKPQYASKCNSNLEILRIIREEGFELDASSVGEIILGLLADFKPNQITFTNLYKSEQDIAFAAKVGVQAITVDSMEELKRVANVCKKIKKRVRIFLRINPKIEILKNTTKYQQLTPLDKASIGQYSTKQHQYGIPIHQAKAAINLAIAAKYVDLTGLHFHGSYIPSPKIFYIAAQKLVKLARYCADKGTFIRTIDLGGGFPVEYKSKRIFRPEDIGEKFSTYFDKLLRKNGLPQVNLVFEPGKFIVNNAGIGLIRIVSEKHLSPRQILVTDGSTYAFLPDPIIYKCYYDILPATKMTRPRVREYNIAGVTCDSIDILGYNRLLPILKENDLLAIMDCGAYSQVMASNFNSLKRAPMVIIWDDSTVNLIRRRDRYSEMFAPELDVLKVADPKELKQLYNLFRVNVDKLWRGGKKLK